MPDGATLEDPAAPAHRAGHPLLRFVVRRALVGVVLVLAVSILVFAATQLLPGDAARAALGSRASEAQIAEVRAQLGLDRPAVVRYADWIGGLLRGDLGHSLVSGSVVGGAGQAIPVSELVRERAANTFVLAAITIALLIPLSLVLGALAGIRPGGVLDQVISVGTLAGIAVPEFVAGTVLILTFAIRFHLLPPVSIVAPGESPLSHPSVLVLPVATLLIVALGFSVRQVRAGVAEAMQSDYVQMARLHGLREREVVVRFALRNSIAPAIQTLTQVMQYFLGGVVLVEFVFDYPGLGQGMVQFVAARDLPTIQAVAVLVAAVYIALNIVADLLVVLVVPRLRTTVR